MSGSRFDTSADHAAALDARDTLAALRQEFEVPAHDGEPLAYLCGHSLGLMPRAARAAVDAELSRWAQRAVDGHFDVDGWFTYHERFAAPLAGLVGAHPDEVVVMNTLTANLHLLLVSFYRPTAERYKIVIERGAFPSDRYAVQSQLRFHGLDPGSALIELGAAASAMLDTDELADVLAAEGERIALVMLPGVQYLTGQALEIEHICELAHGHGCMVGFDLAHAVGNIELALHTAGADFAVWCSYKYLNAGPGAVGGAFVHRRWHGDSRLPRFEGWWGHSAGSRFGGAKDFEPMPGAAAWQLSNPPILSLAPLAASLALFDRAGLDRLREKSAQLTGYCERLLHATLGEECVVLTPPATRGCQLSIRLKRMPDPHVVESGLRARGIVADCRADILRLAPVPLYNRYGDVHRAVRALGELLR